MRDSKRGGGRGLTGGKYVLLLCIDGYPFDSMYKSFSSNRRKYEEGEVT